MQSLTGADYGVITNLLNSVMLAMDTGEEFVFSSCFTADGTCDIKLMNQTFSGTEQLAGLCAMLAEKFRDARHWEGNVCITEGEGGRIMNTSYWKAIDGGEIISTGVHRDVLVRHPNIEGQWLIKNRIIDHTYTKAGGKREI